MIWWEMSYHRKRYGVKEQYEPDVFDVLDECDIDNEWTELDKITNKFLEDYDYVGV